MLPLSVKSAALRRTVLTCLILFAGAAPLQAKPQPAPLPAGVYARGVPKDVLAAITGFRNAGESIQDVAFTPKRGGWVVVSSAHVASKNIPQACLAKITELLAGGHPIRRVAFTSRGGWAVLSEQQYFAQGLPQALADRINVQVGIGETIRDLAITRKDAWVVISSSATTYHIYAAGLNPNCFQALSNVVNQSRFPIQTAFTAGKGCAILEQQNYTTVSAPVDLTSLLQQLRNTHPITDLTFTAKGTGWLVIAP